LAFRALPQSPPSRLDAAMPPSTTTDPSAGALISSALGAFLVMAAATAVQVITITPPHAAHPSAPFVHPVPPLPERSHLHSPLEPASSDEPTTPDDDPTCVDDHPSCPAWASAGECSKNAAFMRSSCRASCHVCNSTRPRPRELSSCEDSNANCATWAAIGECDSNPGYMLHHCPVTCRMCQSATCFDKSDDCAARCRGGAASNFSAAQKCYSDPRLLGECAWTCGACAEHRFSKPQCKRDPSAAPAAVPGSVDKIFSSIAAREGATVHSREPWVITVDNFLSHQEADEVIAAGSNHGTGWARSQAGDGIQAARTSSTAWCEGKCLANPTVQRIEARVSELLLGIPMEYSEPMQASSCVEAARGAELCGS